MPIRVIWALCLLFSIALSALPAQAQSPRVLPATSYVKWAASAPAEAAVGSSFDVHFSATIEAPWKLYAFDSPLPSWKARFSWEALPAGLESSGEAVQSEPIEEFDPYFNAVVRFFKKEVAIDVPVAVAESATAGSLTLGGKIGFQICNDDLGICLPPTYTTVSSTVSIVADTPSLIGDGAGNEAEAVLTAPQSLDPNAIAELDAALEREAAEAPVIAENDDAPVISSTDVLREARSGGFWGFLALAIGAGLGALLMPCTFPMIPLTVSYFTKHADDRRKAFKMASVYGLSIVVIFTALGILMALLIGASGAQMIAANPWINLFIGGVFVLFAMSLLGLFELRLPNSVVNFFNKKSNEQGGYGGVLFMGVTLTLVSFSCTAPFVGTLLAATAGGEWFWPILGMIIFSATFALPFILFALFPNGLSRLPSSGQWMNTLKVVFGFIELAAALKFISNADLVWNWGLLSRPLAIALTVVIFFVAGFYLLGKIRLRHEEPVEQIGPMRLIFAMGFIGLALYMVPGLLGAPLNNLDAFLPPRRGTDVSLMAAMPSQGALELMEDENWFKDVDEALEVAKREAKPLFIDFTGYTCTNCRQMEANVFPRPAIAERFERDFVLVKLFTDDIEKGLDLQQYQLTLTGTVALPTYAVVDPETEQLITSISGIRTEEKFAQFLDSGSARFAQMNLAYQRR